MKFSFLDCQIEIGTEEPPLEKETEREEGWIKPQLMEKESEREKEGWIH